MFGFSSTHTPAYPAQPNSSPEFVLERKYLSVHAMDRDVKKYPNSSEFSFNPPDNYSNISSCRLSSWSLPSISDVISVSNYNVQLLFTLPVSGLYNPPQGSDETLVAIHSALSALNGNLLSCVVEAGTYTPEQMAAEMEYKLNGAVTHYLNDYFEDTPEYTHLVGTIYYDRFIAVYHEITQKMRFGNNADAFVFTNDAREYWNEAQRCGIPQTMPASGRTGIMGVTDWGLPYNLGFARTSASSEPLPSDSIHASEWSESAPDGAVTQALFAPEKINLMGKPDIYMEMNGYNCIDETAPYQPSLHTTKTGGMGSGKSNAAFAKINIKHMPVARYADNESAPYKYFLPPLERVQRLDVRFRHHTGELVDFGNFDFSFVIEFTILRPQTGRPMVIRDTESLRQAQNGGQKPEDGMSVISYY